MQPFVLDTRQIKHTDICPVRGCVTTLVMTHAVAKTCSVYVLYLFSVAVEMQLLSEKNKIINFHTKWSIVIVQSDLFLQGQHTLADSFSTDILPAGISLVWKKNWEKLEKVPLAHLTSSRLFKVHFINRVQVTVIKRDYESILGVCTACSSLKKN